MKQPFCVSQWGVDWVSIMGCYTGGFFLEDLNIIFFFFSAFYNNLSAYNNKF